MRFLAPPIVALAVLAALAAMPAGATLNMNEGLWETTVTADGQAHSASAKCYTRMDIAEMEKLLRGKSSRVDGICHYADFTQSGDSVNYTMTCRLGDDEQTSAVSATSKRVVPSLPITRSVPASTWRDWASAIAGRANHTTTSVARTETIDETAAESKTVNRMINKPPSYQVRERRAAGT